MIQKEQREVLFLPSFNSLANWYDETYEKYSKKA